MTGMLDKEGFETLNAIAGADRFNTWMFNTIRPFIKGRVLEIGSGIGNISSQLLLAQNDVTVSDYSHHYRNILRHRFNGDRHLSGILNIDLVDRGFDEKNKAILGSFDTVIALNVIEHIADHDLAVCNCRKLLKPGGHFIMLVPAYAGLFNRFDRALGHYRRYTAGRLQQVLAPYFRIERVRYFNLAGIAGWVFSGSILRKKIIPSSHMRIYNALVPVFKLLDKIAGGRVGLSVWALGSANNDALS